MKRLFLIAAASAFLHAQAADLVEHVQNHRDGKAPWSISFSAFETDRSKLPIGVFDSGIGGLTVLDSVLQLDAFNNDTLKPGPDGNPDFAGEKFVYLGDQANMPYGNYPSQGQTEYLRELALKDAVFLLGNRWRANAKDSVRTDKPPVKAIVIACNTATAYALEDIRAALRAWKLDVPVIGVVEAGARGVAAILPDDGKAHGVAVLATVGTCQSKAYPKAIAQATGRAGKSAPTVVQQGSIGLAGAIEGNQAFVSEGERTVSYLGPKPDAALWPTYQFAPEGLLDRELNSIANYVRYDVTSALEEHRRTGGPAIDTVVLGCTHFPLVKSELAQAFQKARSYKSADGSQPYGKVVAEKIEFVDPSEATARELFTELARARLRNKEASEAPPRAEFFLSVPNPQAPGVKLAPDGALDGNYKVSRKTGQFEVEDTVVVPLTLETLPSSSAKLVRALPAVQNQLEASAK